MSDDPRIVDVQRRLLRPSSADDVLSTLAVLDSLSAAPDFAKQADGGLRRAFECLRGLTASRPDLAAAILINDLLPRCLVPERSDIDGFGHWPCYVFGEWLRDLPEDKCHEVRLVALPRAVEAFGSEAVRNAIRLVSSIAYWDEYLLDSLDQLAREHEDETGDHAMSARVGLGEWLNEGAREFYLNKLHRRIPAGPNLHQILCGRDIGTRVTAELVWQHWLASPKIDMPEWGLFASLARSAVVEIADRENDRGFTEHVWGWLVEISRRPTQTLEDVFAPNSSLVNGLDISAAVPELIRLAISSEPHHRYLYYLRVLECERLSHMAGWDEIADAQLDIVRKDAIMPSGMRGRASTIELHRKEAAWDVLLCRGDRASLPSFGDALMSENGYAANHFLELAACLQPDPLPMAVGPLVAGAPTAVEWNENERLVAQIGAIQAAHGAGSREAFDSLLDYRQLGGGVLLSLVEALAETASLLTDAGDRYPVEKLLETAENSLRVDARSAAGGAVAVLLEEGHLTNQETSRAAALLPRPTTDVFVRRELLFALASRDPAEIPPSGVTYANSSLAQPADENPEVYPAALALKARCPGMSSDSDFLSRLLGLSDDGGTLLASSSTLNRSSPGCCTIKGADPNGKDESQYTPPDWAADNGHAEVLKLLEDAARHQPDHAAHLAQRRGTDEP